MPSARMTVFFIGVSVKFKMATSQTNNQAKIQANIRTKLKGAIFAGCRAGHAACEEPGETSGFVSVFRAAWHKGKLEHANANRFPAPSLPTVLRRRWLQHGLAATLVAAVPAMSHAQTKPVETAPKVPAKTAADSAKASPKPSTKTPPVILIYGDSISAEYGLARGTGWAALLEKRLAERKLPHTVVNASISGETTSGGLSRFPEVLARVKPTVLVLELGGNDALRGLPLTMSRQNLATMIESAQKAGSTVVLAGMQMPPNYGKAYTDAFRTMYPELSKQYKTALIPHFLEGVGEKRELFQSDGIHPTAAAQPRMMENVWQALEPVVAKK
jgi:acyl-CoA thioesterase I